MTMKANTKMQELFQLKMYLFRPESTLTGQLFFEGVFRVKNFLSDDSYQQLDFGRDMLVLAHFDHIVVIVWEIKYAILKSHFSH